MKVVSSMGRRNHLLSSEKDILTENTIGEQSVGKSFALNHLVDTSFAMSAMRTTDGVWMSVAPTDDALIVALDFEGGIHTTHHTCGSHAVHIGIRSTQY